MVFNSLIICYGEVAIGYQDYRRIIELPITYTSNYKGFITILDETGGEPTSAEGNARVMGRNLSTMTICGYTYTGFDGMTWLTIGYSLIMVLFFNGEHSLWFLLTKIVLLHFLLLVITLIIQLLWVEKIAMLL